MHTRPFTDRESLGMLSLSLLAVLTGIVAGLGAVAFRDMIGIFHNVLFLGKFSFDYNANAHTPASPWGPFVILVPVLGAVIVAFLVSNFAPEAKGHGVPEVMDAIHHNRGVIRPIVALIKSVASALSIGSGGSVGREGPIVQIGASFGSTVGQILRLPTWQVITLISVGAGGGIAATFNTPVGGVLFAVELIMVEVSARTLVPVAIGTATAAYVGRLFFGERPSFVIPAFRTSYFQTEAPMQLIAYAALGIILGIVSMVYIKSIYKFEDFFDDRVKGSYYRRHMLGMLLVGVIMYLMFVFYGHYYVQGVGYSTIQDVLSSVPFPIYLLVLLAALKLLVTSLTLGSGASGGIFSPSLFMGATLGGAYGYALNALFPNIGVAPAAFAVAGMAGVVSGATGAAVTAIVMVFEMTVDYNVILPMTIVSAVAYGFRKWLLSDSIYTLKLARRGHSMPDALEANVRLHRRARNMMNTHFAAFGPNTKIDHVGLILQQDEDLQYVVAADDDGVYGFLARTAALEAPPDSTLSEVANTSFIIIRPNATLLDIAQRLCSEGAEVAVVVIGARPSAGAVRGVLPRKRVSDIMADSLEMFSE